MGQPSLPWERLVELYAYSIDETLTAWLLDARLSYELLPNSIHDPNLAARPPVEYRLKSRNGIITRDEHYIYHMLFRLGMKIDSQIVNSRLD